MFHKLHHEPDDQHMEGEKELGCYTLLTRFVVHSIFRVRKPPRIAISSHLCTPILSIPESQSSNH